MSERVNVQKLVLDEIVERLEVATDGPAPVNFHASNTGHVYGMGAELNTVVDVTFDFQTSYATFDVKVVDGPNRGSADFGAMVEFKQPMAVPDFLRRLDAALAGS